MRAVVNAAKDTIEIQDRPIPEIAADEVLLKVAGAGLCHSDLSILGRGDERLIGDILGHEVSGVVEAVGESVADYRPGDAAIVSLVLSCGHCRECLRGRQNQCREIAHRKVGAPLSPGIGRDGGMAEYIAVKEQHLDPLGGLSPRDAAPLSDAALTSMHAVNSVRDRLDSDATVLVLGLGGLGHVALQILAATTGARIIAADTDGRKVDYAAEHGADLALVSGKDTAERVLKETDGWGADVVLDFVGIEPTVETTKACIATGGQVRLVGIGGGTIDYGPRTNGLPWGVNVERAYGGNRSDMREVLALAQAGKISLELTHYDLEDAKEAFDDLANGRIQGRAVLVPGA